MSVLLQVSFSLIHVLCDLGLTLCKGSIATVSSLVLRRSWWTCRLGTHQLTDLVRNLFITLLIRDLPHVLFLILSLSDQALLPLLRLNDVVSIILVRLIGLGAIRVDLNRVGKPTRVIPARLQEAIGQGAFLEQFLLVAQSGLNSHVFQVANGVLVLDRHQEGLVQGALRL